MKILPPQPPLRCPRCPPICFDRNEFAGAFSELGTDLPLLIGHVAARHRLGISRVDLLVALLVGLLCAGLPYGYPVGLVAGTAVYYAMQRRWTGLGNKPAATRRRPLGARRCSCAAAAQELTGS
ncbi:hypothetical protein [Hymenobacter sp. PAMC 26628]|uniref:hypothetical protein n=1 Tax=Hymenobacter sp. PAMC 26628 TaxID=1484118 RepID=UPI00194F3B22|nr:hypothetical protein [Hymenobacter sp. PAMC 26628]